MRRLLFQTCWETYPYLSKLDKGIGPDPLPRSPPFLPAKSFSTKATFPVRAASSSSWSLPMVGNHQRILLPTRQPFQKRCALPPSPHSATLARKTIFPALHSSELSNEVISHSLHRLAESGGEEGGGRKHPSLDNFWVECGREKKLREPSTDMLAQRRGMENSAPPPG